MTFDSNNNGDNANIIHNKTLLGNDFEDENGNSKKKGNTIIEFVNKKQKNTLNNKQNIQDNEMSSGLFDVNNKKKKKGLLSKIADVFGTTSFVSTNEVENVFTNNDKMEEEDDIYTTPAIKRKIG